MTTSTSAPTSCPGPRRSTAFSAGRSRWSPLYFHPRVTPWTSISWRSMSVSLPCTLHSAHNDLLHSQFIAMPITGAELWCAGYSMLRFRTFSSHSLSPPSPPFRACLPEGHLQVLRERRPEGCPHTRGLHWRLPHQDATGTVQKIK